MTEPFDVSLRVRLAYEAGGAAKTAIADIEAMRISAAKLGASAAMGTATRDIGDLGRHAVAAKAGLEDLAQAGARLATTAGPAVVAAGIGKVGAEAASAGRAVDQLGDKLGAALKAQRALGGFKNGAELEAFLKTFDAGTKSATMAVGTLGVAAEKLGASAGPPRLAEELKGISPAAVEARRHIDDVGTAAHTAQRNLERMGKAAQAAGGGSAGGGGGHGGHGEPGFGRDFKRGAAMPLQVERMAALATSAGGLAGLGLGYGLMEVGRGMASLQGQAIDFETAMVGVRRAVGDMPDAGIKHLEGTILDVSRATGAAKGELAGVAAAALRAGQPVADLPAFLERAAKTANVMGFSLTEAGDKMIGLGRAWRMDKAGVADTTDAIALLAQRTGAKAGNVMDFDIANADMRERHMSARQLSAFGASFDVQGAGGAFRDLADKLAMPQKAGPEFANRMFAMGVDVNKTRADMRNDPTRTIRDVLERFKRLPEEHRANVLEQMFGPEGGRDIGRVVDHLGDLDRALGVVEDPGARHGALDKMFKVFDETTRAKIDKASEAMGAFAVNVGQKFAPAVSAAAEATERLFNGMSRVLETSDRAAAILDKQGKGEPLTPEEQDPKDPKLRSFLGLDPDPAATASKREIERQKALKSIQGLDATAQETQDPQIRMSVEQMRRDYRQDYPERAEGEENGGAKPPGNPAAGGPAGMPPHGRHSSILDPSMIHRASYVDGQDDRSLAGGSATDDMRAVIAAATKEGVVAGLREVLDMRGGSVPAAGGIVDASFRSGDGGEIGGEGGGSGHRSIRYGGGFAPEAGGAHARRSLRYGGGYGPHGPGTGSHPAYGAAVPGANGYGKINAPYTAAIDHKGEGGQLSPKEMFDYLKARGATDNEATMLTGAAGNESSFNPNAVHDGGHGHGLWGHNDKRIDMRGKSWQQQADLALTEVKKQYADRVNGAKTPEELADAEMHYERPRGYTSRNPRGGDNYTGRANTLRRFGDAFGTMKSLDPSKVAAATGHGSGGQGQFPDWMNDRSKRELAAVNGDLARDLLAASKETGVHFNVAQGLRSQGEADANARTGRGVRDSQHLYGAAADLHMLDAEGKETYDRETYKRFGDAFEKIQRQHGGKGRWLGNLPGRWGSDIVHFDQGIGYGQGHPRDPYGQGGPTKDDVARGNLDAYKSPQNPFFKRPPNIGRSLNGEGTVSPRFSQGMTSASLRREEAPGNSTGGTQSRQVATSPAPIQNFYGNHDPAQTARMAMLEQNREVRRAQARALHSVGRVA